MNVRDLVIELIEQTLADGELREGNTEIPIQEIDPLDTVVFSLPFHVDVADTGEKRVHSDGLRVDVFTFKDKDQGTPWSPKGVG